MQACVTEPITAVNAPEAAPIDTRHPECNNPMQGRAFAGEEKMSVFRILLVSVVIAAGTAGAGAQQDLLINSLLFNLTHPDKHVRERSLQKIGELNDKAAVPALVDILRFNRIFELDIFPVLEQLTGKKLPRAWPPWVEYLQRQTDIEPNSEYAALKSYLLRLVDASFGKFLYQGVPHRTRIEEIVWGGVAKDGIPALTNPRHLEAEDAAYLTEDELVFGVSLNGENRAYPLRIMNWHEMFNDVVGGRPVTLSY
jgi:hypothetical protein